MRLTVSARRSAGNDFSWRRWAVWRNQGKTVAFLNRVVDNNAAASTSCQNLGGKPMKGTTMLRSILTALAALTFSGGHLSAGDLYNKEPAKVDQTPLPKPA